jgi:hypothetical protein
MKNHPLTDDAHLLAIITAQIDAVNSGAEYSETYRNREAFRRLWSARCEMRNAKSFTLPELAAGRRKADTFGNDCWPLIDHARYYPLDRRPFCIESHPYLPISRLREDCETMLEDLGLGLFHPGYPSWHHPLMATPLVVARLDSEAEELWPLWVPRVDLIGV